MFPHYVAKPLNFFCIENRSTLSQQQTTTESQCFCLQSVEGSFSVHDGAFKAAYGREKSYAILLPFKGTTEGSSITLGIDGGSRNRLLTLSGIPMNCRLKHCSEALPERPVLNMHVRLKMLEQRKDDRNLTRHTSFTKAQCSSRSWIT